MPMRIKVANHAEEQDAVYRLRAAVGHPGRYKTSPTRGVPMRLGAFDGRPPSVVDHFDAFPTSVQIIAEVNGLAVGSLRVCRKGEIGNPVESLELDDNSVLLDQFAVAPAYRRNRGLIFNLLKIATRVSNQNEDAILRRLWIDAPLWCDNYLREIGFSKHDDAPNDGQQLWHMFREEMRASFLEPSISGAERFTEAHHRVIYQKGEAIFLRGEAAEAIFVVARGSVRLVGPRADGTVVEIARVGPGEVLGEEVGSDKNLRWLDAYADAPETDLYTMGRERFLQEIQTDQTLQGEYRNLLTQRLHHTVTHLLGYELEATNQRVLQILKDRTQYALERGADSPIPLVGCTPEWLSAQSATSVNNVNTILEQLGPSLRLAEDEVVITDAMGLLSTSIADVRSSAPMADTFAMPALSVLTPQSAMDIVHSR